MTRRAAIVLQARMASARLPGKAMEILGGKPLVERCIERLRSAGGFPVVLATTTRRDDDILAELGERLGIRVVRGAENDVLGRFVQALDVLGVDSIVRATGDNPAVDFDAAQRTLEMLWRAGADHVVERGLPIGAAVEAVSANALRLASTLTSDSYDREHVTPFIKSDPRFLALPAIAPGRLHAPQLRLTVDTPDDLERMRRLVAAVGADAFDRAPLAAIIDCARELGTAGSGGAGRRGAR